MDRNILDKEINIETIDDYEIDDNDEFIVDNIKKITGKTLGQLTFKEIGDMLKSNGDKLTDKEYNNALEHAELIKPQPEVKKTRQIKAKKPLLETLKKNVVEIEYVNLNVNIRKDILDKLITTSVMADLSLDTATELLIDHFMKKEKAEADEEIIEKFYEENKSTVKLNKKK